MCRSATVDKRPHSRQCQRAVASRHCGIVPADRFEGQAVLKLVYHLRGRDSHTEVSSAHSRLATVNALIRAPDNLSSYEEPALVEALSTHSELQSPERAILDRITTWLSGKRMLDLGVGGGRTTLHFAPVAGSYVGIDRATHG